MWLLVSLVLVGCPKSAPGPDVEKPAMPAMKEAPSGEALDGSGLVDLEKARTLLKGNKYEDLLGVFEPNQVDGMTPEERSILADLFHEAALNLKNRFKKNNRL